VIVIGSMISLGYYLPVLAAMWMRPAPAGAGRRGDPPGPGAEALPALAGGSPELEPEAQGAVEPPWQARGERLLGAQPEVALVAIAAALATIFFGIIPQPLFELVHGAGRALGLL